MGRQAKEKTSSCGLALSTFVKSLHYETANLISNKWSAGH